MFINKSITKIVIYRLLFFFY